MRDVSIYTSYIVSKNKAMDQLEGDVMCYFASRL